MILLQLLFLVAVLLLQQQHCCLSFSPPSTNTKKLLAASAISTSRQNDNQFLQHTQRVVLSQKSSLSITQQQHHRQQHYNNHRLHPLNAITKRQSFILDGAELSYYIQNLADQKDHDGYSDGNNNNESSSSSSSNNSGSRSNGDDNSNKKSETTAATNDDLPNVAPRSLIKRNRVAHLTFVTVVLDEDLVVPTNDMMFATKNIRNYGVTENSDDDADNSGDDTGSNTDDEKRKREESVITIERGTRIIGVEVPNKMNEESSESTEETATTTNRNNSRSNKIRTIISIPNDDIQLYQDTIAIIPKTKMTMSDSDVISTAAASLLGVHCSSVAKGLSSTSRAAAAVKRRKRAVIVGGGEYALFLARAFAALNIKVYLVTARPTWSLPQDMIDSSSTSNINKDDNMIEILPPSVGPMSLGFTMAIGEFDVLIDTLGDEMGMGRARSILDYDIGSSSLWRELHGCQEYISTVTRSQQYVLGKGLLFARDAVIRYQKEVEGSRGVTLPSVPPPRNFGTTIQLLLDQHVLYPNIGSNEVGGTQGDKSTFVRGWSLSDLTELKTWPRASEGSGRFGFPVVDLNASRARGKRSSSSSSGGVEEARKMAAVMAGGDATKDGSVTTTDQDSTSSEELTSSESIMENTSNTTSSTRQIKVTRSAKKAVSNNPYVTNIHSASELNQKIVAARRNCVLFLTASYCQKCKRLTPQFQRLARKKSSEVSTSSTGGSNNGVLFAHVDISAGPKGKQLGKLLNVEKVPSIILFRDGKQVGVERGSGEASIVIERGSMNRLEQVVDSLERGDTDLKLKDLMSPEKKAAVQ